MPRLPLLLAFGATLLLGGCDWWGSAPPAAPAAPATVACNCQPPIRGTVEPAPVAAESGVTSERHRHYAHRARYGYGASGYAYSEREAQSSVDIYGYSSSSHVEQSYGAGGDCCEGASYGNGTRAWEDGYDRRHIYDENAVAHYSHQAHLRHVEERWRLDPWHGYDDRWDW